MAQYFLKYGSSCYLEIGTGLDSHDACSSDAEATDPTLLKENSEVRSFSTSAFTYPKLRIFYRRHPKANELPTDPAPLPLLVFIHGLGGSVAQFHPLLTSLSNHASCLAVDLPGCGRSEFAPKQWSAYTTDALIDLLEHIIDTYRDKENGQGVVLIAHSMGTALAARLANKRAPNKMIIAEHVVGVVGICPVAGPLSDREITFARRLAWVPSLLFNIFRFFDSWGGPESASVKRFLGPDADLRSKELQERFNKQSRTPVFRRMLYGMLPVNVDGTPMGGLFCQASWAGLDVPVFLVGGENDTVVKPDNVRRITDMLKSDISPSTSNRKDVVDSDDDKLALAATSKSSDHLPRSIDTIADKDFTRKANGSQKVAMDGRSAVEETYEDPITPHDVSMPRPDIPPQPLHPEKVVRSLIMPAPSNHALLFVPSTARPLAGLIGNFLFEHVTARLDLAWQLQYLSKDGKWDVKNLVKWQAVQPVSGDIKGIFRAMKTLREVDEKHSPEAFTAKWGSIIKDVIDISHDNPVYDAKGLERIGIKYHKFPTKSKKTPTDAEVSQFKRIVDDIRESQARRSEEEGWTQECFIGVHCHYGFNRTGYFIVCYLVERCGLSLQEALDTFAIARPQGIRHSHFLDALEMRYYDMKRI